EFAHFVDMVHRIELSLSPGVVSCYAPAPRRLSAQAVLAAGEAIALHGAVAIHAVVRTGLTYFKWGLIVTVLAGLGIWLYVSRHVDDELRRQAEAWLAGRFPQLAVSVDSGRLVEGEGIYLRGVRLQQAGVGEG